MTELSSEANAAAIGSVLAGRCGDPFGVLGLHGTTLRVFLPGAAAVEVLAKNEAPLARLEQMGETGMFIGTLPKPVPYLLKIDWHGTVQMTEDPYSFGLLLGELDIHLLAEGRHRELASCMGAHVVTVDGVVGVRFAVWAPNAQQVAVVGDFNSWDGRRNPMRRRVEAGVWEVFIPRLRPGAVYKYQLVAASGEILPLKADPVAAQAEIPPATGSIVAEPVVAHWTDDEWMRTRAARQSPTAAISIYEVHAASWLRPDGQQLDWEGLAARLVPYAVGMGFTHLELMPIMSHPFAGSWGYQPLGQFAPMPQMGPPHMFARFVNACHGAGLGVILDWVPAHFPSDAHGLAMFDGSALYEHGNPLEGFHPDWNTLIYNLGRNEVRGFMIASALHWLEQFHVDALRVDAVASMLYRDYSRKAGEWVPNIHGGRENLESVAFLQEMNRIVAERCPGAITIAEESTAWPGVTAPVAENGLGFTFKWNMGWMHDSLEYMATDPLYRSYHYDRMTFGLVYAFSERFVLPLSHDEVVHGKGSLLNKMPGDDWQRLANLRAYYGFMWTHPGKKLLFMGCEFAQPAEWNHDASLNWGLLDQPAHRGVQALVRDLNQLYRALPALHTGDAEPAGFRWVVGDDRDQSVYAFLRLDQVSGAAVLVICNLTPVPRMGYRIGLPAAGRWVECLNSDAVAYGGSGVGNFGSVMAEATPSHGLPASASFTIAPLATMVFRAE